MKIAVFASGNGSNFQVLAEQFPNNVKFVFSDKPNAFVLKRAEALHIPRISFGLKEFPNKAAYEEEIAQNLETQQIDLIVLAGYMKIIGPTILNKYCGKIINIHPSLLPEFAGSPHAIEDSWQERTGLGVTVHYVDTGVDTGEIIAQRPVPYHDNLEKYEEKLHQIEHELYPEVVQKLIAEFEESGKQSAN
ncbi:MAG: phosphoribosylglycinamide formyltransferase [Streptococcaceae bacterium]|jgi:phosphoribosylglycinamide formyltransferase-1|nr:phosphoribosylglycinamide formyltransferase [Streptococcaceae bacterium]